MRMGPQKTMPSSPVATNIHTNPKYLATKHGDVFGDLLNMRTIGNITSTLPKYLAHIADKLSPVFGGCSPYTPALIKWHFLLCFGNL